MIRCHSHQPYPIYTTVLTGKNLPPNVGYRPKIPKSILEMLERPETPPGTMKAKLIQTLFRESEAQTDPFEADVAEIKDQGLEILTLGWLSWDHGLPAGINEVNTIERARQKRSWEAALPIPFDQTTRDIRTMIINAMEINEWNYREEMIAAVGSLRMELAEKLMKQSTRENKLKCEERLSKYVFEKKEEKNKKIQKLRLKFNREIRKLTYARQKVNRKYYRVNVIKQFRDKTSELYGPQMRFGEDPSRRHEIIRPKNQYLRVFKKLETLHHTTFNILKMQKPGFDFQNKSKPVPKGNFCVRATKWTEENLLKLYNELKFIRKKAVKPAPTSYFKRKILVEQQSTETSKVDGIPDDEEELYQACLFLQKIIKGRAIQAAMFEGRVKCQELIEELKSTHALQNNLEDVNTQLRRRVYGLQRQAEIEQIQEKRKQEILAYLEGKTMGDMLDFLSKELLRLQNERKTHAMALAADQERHKREAMEAGRRQVEEKRRREHDEMFKQIIKQHQNSVQRFLEKTFLETKQWMAERDARSYVTEMAKKIDKAADEMNMVPLYVRPDDLKEEELVADLIHNFALPEVEKRLVRKRLIDKQRNYLKVCHDEVYSNIEKAVKGKRTREGVLLPLPMVGKHKVPPLVPVRYLRLKRTHESSSSSSSQLSNLTGDIIEVGQNVNRPEQSQSPRESCEKDKWSTGFSRQEVILKNEEKENDKFIADDDVDDHDDSGN